MKRKAEEEHPIRADGKLPHRHTQGGERKQQTEDRVTQCMMGRIRGPAGGESCIMGILVRSR